MSRQPLIHSPAGQSTQSASVKTARTRLFVVDVDRKKRIDDSIDYFATAACAASSSLPTRAAKRCSTRCSTRTECSVSAEEQQWFITTVRIVRPRSDSGLDHCNGASSSDARHYKSIDGIKALLTEHPFSAVPRSRVIGPRKRPVLVAPPPGTGRELAARAAAAVPQVVAILTGAL